MSSTDCTVVNMKELKALAQFPVPHHSLHHWTDINCPLVGISAEKGQDQVALMLNSTLTPGVQERAACAVEKQSFSVTRAANLVCCRNTELQRDLSE